MIFNTLKDHNFDGKTVLLRADLNVPVTKDREITDTTRIDRLKPTIDYLASQNAKIVIMSHFGRPKGIYEEDMSLSFLPKALEKSWGTKVIFTDDCAGEKSKAIIKNLEPGQIALLENLRFHEGEEKNDSVFAEKLASMGDIYVNDAFSTSHRAHASTEAITNILPSCAGLLMEAELNALNSSLDIPKKPVFAFVGGAKISTKLSVLHNLSKKVDYMFLGGGMANTFLHAKGYDIGKSLCENDMADEALNIIKHAEDNDCKIILPSDLVMVHKLEDGAEHSIWQAENMDSDMIAVDNGPRTIKEIKDILDSCKTVIWNGPLGVFEIKPFDNSTNEIALYVAKLTKEGKMKSFAGGGDTVAALENANAADNFSYISTAGGAFLEWLEGKTLPGVAALMKNCADTHKCVSSGNSMKI